MYTTSEMMMEWMKRTWKKKICTYRTVTKRRRENHTHIIYSTYVGRTVDVHRHTHTHTQHIQSVERRIVSEPKQLQSPTVTWQTHPVPAIVFVYIYYIVCEWARARVYVRRYIIYNTQRSNSSPLVCVLGTAASYRPRCILSRISVEL